MLQNLSQTTKSSSISRLTDARDIINDVLEDNKQSIITDSPQKDWPDELELTYDEAMEACHITTGATLRNWENSRGLINIGGTGKKSRYKWGNLKSAMISRYTKPFKKTE